jgi:hypothetical protein
MKNIRTCVNCKRDFGTERKSNFCSQTCRVRFSEERNRKHSDELEKLVDIINWCRSKLKEGEQKELDAKISGQLPNLFKYNRGENYPSEKSVYCSHALEVRERTKSKIIWGCMLCNYTTWAFSSMKQTT